MAGSSEREGETAPSGKPAGRAASRRRAKSDSLPAAPLERLPALAALFGLALAVRGLHTLAFWKSSFSPAFYLPIDARLYHVWAIDWLHGSWPPRLPFERPPLYPWLLGLLYGSAGPSPLAALLVQALLGAAGCLLVHGIARELFRDLRVARSAAVACALLGPLVYFDAQLLSASLDVFLGLLLLRLLLLAGRRGALALWLGAGLVAGLSALNRGGVLLFLPFALFWALRLAARGGLARGVAFAAAAGLVILPVSWHNARYDEPGADASAGAAWRRLATGAFAPIATNSGINFYLGNHRELRPFNRLEHPEHMAVYDRIRHEPATRGIESFSAASGYLVRQTLEHAWQRPGDWLALLGIKAAELLNGAEIPRNTSLYADRAESPLLALLLWHVGLAFPSGLLIPFGIAGVFLLRHDWRRHFLPWSAAGAQAVFVLAFFVTARYRLPILPILSIYAAHAALQLWDGWRGSGRAQVERLTGAVALLVVLCNLPIVEVSRSRHWQDLYNVGVAHLEQGERSAAETRFRQSVERNPGAAQALVALCNLLLEDERAAQGLPFCRRAALADSDSASAHYALGATLEAVGRESEALPHYRRAAQLAPGATEPQGALRRLRARRARAGAPREGTLSP